MSGTGWTEMPLRFISTEWCDGPFGSGLASEHYCDSGARVVRLQNIRAAEFAGADEAFIDEGYFSTSLTRHGVLQGDVLVAGLGDDNNLVGRACVAPAGLGPALVKADCFRFRLDRSKADPRFIAYALSATAPRAAGELSGGSTRQRINLGTMASRKLLVPPLAEQQRIATFLDEQTARIDALIAAKERLASSLVEFRTSKICEMVLLGLDGEPTRKTHVQWIGETPLSWVVPRIKHVARLESGHTPDKKVTAYWENCSIPWVSLNDTAQLLRTDYIQDTAVQVNELGIQNSSARLLPKGTVFFSRDATIGRCGIAARPMACSQHFIGWVCGPAVLPEYLLYVLRSMSDELERLTMGATLKTIGMQDVKTLAMPLPPVEEQGRIILSVRRISEKTSALEVQSLAFAERLREYRSSLISAAVTGQMDISTFRPPAHSRETAQELAA